MESAITIAMYVAVGCIVIISFMVDKKENKVFRFTDMKCYSTFLIWVLFAYKLDSMDFWVRMLFILVMMESAMQDHEAYEIGALPIITATVVCLIEGDSDIIRTIGIITMILIWIVSSITGKAIKKDGKGFGDIVAEIGIIGYYSVVGHSILGIVAILVGSILVAIKMLIKKSNRNAMLVEYFFVTVAVDIVRMVLLV
jgi:phosphate/sulfate permease